MQLNWKTYKLGEFANLRKENIHPKNFSNENYIGLEHIGQGTFSLDGIGKATDVTSNKSIFNSGDILYGKIRPYFQKVYRPNFNGICSTDILVINSLDESIVDQSFLYQITKTNFFTEKAVETSTGTKMPRADWNSLSKVEFMLPPLPEQRAIASILSALDDKIELNLQMNKTLEEMAMALYKHWFVDSSDIIDYQNLEDVLEFIVDNRGKTVPTSSEGIPLIATNCVKNDNIYPIYSNIRFISQDTYDSWFRAHPKPGDLLFVNKGTPGGVNFVPNPMDFCIAQDMIALRVNPKIISKYYLFLYLRSDQVQFEIKNKSVGTTIPHLKKTDLIKFKIPIPTIDKLELFDKEVSFLFESININRIQNNLLSQKRDTLLPKLISGEIRVKDIEVLQNV